MKNYLKDNWIYIVIPFFLNIIYLFAFYPGILSFDSFYQWQQLSEFNFTNWHPAYHTILMWVLTKIWYSPATIALFQIFVFSLTLSYGLSSFKKSHIPNSLLIFISVLISINIINGMMLITLWKDILYSIFILALTIHIYNIIKSEGEWIGKKNNSIFFGLTLANIVLLRHNGFPVVVICLLLLFFTYKKYKFSYFKSLIFFVIFVGLIKIPVFNLFKVDTKNSQSFAVTFVHPIAAHVNANVKFTEEETEFLDKIFPLKNSWPYSCYDATVLFYEGVNFQPVNENPLFLGKLFLNYTFKNPTTTLNHFLCLSSFTWQVLQPDEVYLETVLFDSLNTEQFPQWQKYSRFTEQNSLLPGLRDLITKLGKDSLMLDKYKILWRPALYMYAFLLIVILLVVKTNDKKYFLLSAPLLSQTIVIMGTAQLQALRYQYPVYLISMLFVIPLIYIFLNTPYKGKINET